jgi:succinate dehydrogenase/fumarate reductase flavoprotein subunit
MAAYEASKHGASVLVVSKDAPQRGGATIMAPGAIAAAGGWAIAGDSPDVHLSDTVCGGSYLSEQGLVRLVVEETPDLVLELERIGAMWQREADGRTYALRIDGGHSYARCPYLEDRTGREMLRSLVGELRRRGVSLTTGMMVLKLLLHEGRIAGAAALDLATCETVLVRAKTVILACGGAGNAYANTSCPTGVTGDGFALALDAGATLMDMEFVQFFPLGFCFPHSLRGCLGGLLFHVHLLNNRGERFMERHDPERLELSTRDRVSRAMFTEIREGRGGPHGGVFADMTYQPPGFIERMQPALFHTYRKIGIDPSRDLLELAPTCHFFMGGGVVTTDWESTVPGLFLVGENAADIHGANRLSQNALSQLLVSGVRAGRAAAAQAKEFGQAPVDPAEASASAEDARRMLAREDGIRPHVWRSRLREAMWENAGVYRSGSSLRAAMHVLDELEGGLASQALSQRSRRHNTELSEAIENRFLLVTARCVVEAALRRDESRGAHYRDDFPATNDREWLLHLAVRRGAAGLEWSSLPVDLRELRPEAGAER